MKISKLPLLMSFLLIIQLITVNTGQAKEDTLELTEVGIIYTSYLLPEGNHRLFMECASFIREGGFGLTDGRLINFLGENFSDDEEAYVNGLMIVQFAFSACNLYKFNKLAYAENLKQRENSIETLMDDPDQIPNLVIDGRIWEYLHLSGVERDEAQQNMASLLWGNRGITGLVNISNQLDSDEESIEAKEKFKRDALYLYPFLMIEVDNGFPARHLSRSSGMYRIIAKPLYKRIAKFYEEDSPLYPFDKFSNQTIPFEKEKEIFDLIDLAVRFYSEDLTKSLESFKQSSLEEMVLSDRNQSLRSFFSDLTQGRYSQAENRIEMRFKKR